MTQVASHFSNDLYRDQPVAGPSTYHLIDASTPSASTLVYSSSAERLVEPLGPAKTIRELSLVPNCNSEHAASSSRRGVIFSQRNETKFFHAGDTLLPKDAPPASIRSYPDSDPISPFDSPSLGRSRSSSGTPSLVRSILKAKHTPIGVVATWEEGTRLNKEPARLVVSGKRPTLVARDSFQLAMIRKAASEKAALPASDDAPPSDDSTGSDDAPEREMSDQASAEDSEEEETLEAEGALETSSLINIVIDGAEDLLTLEEAYSTLCERLGVSTKPTSIASPAAPSRVDSVRIAMQPMKDNATAVIMALQRDLGRLLGKVPSEERASSDFESSPFRGLMPLRDTTPINHATATPSPSPPNSKKSPEGPRQGYSEAEVRYRREAAGVGVAAMKFIAFVFNRPEICKCFTDADLAAVLETILIIPRTPVLPTPNPKKTYHTSILVLSQMRIPLASVLPAKEKVARAIELALLEQLGNAPRQAPAGGKEGFNSPTKKEAFIGVANLVSTYPSLFLPHFAELLPACLRGMISRIPLHRSKASAAVAAFANAKVSHLASTLENAHQQNSASAREQWNKAKMLNQKLEHFVAAHLKSPLRLPGKASPVYGQNGEKKTEASAVEQVFKDTIGNNPDVAWACAAWSSLVTLLGSSYSSSGLSVGLDFIMDRSIQASNNAIRPPLARTAWLHSVHAHLSAGAITTLTEEGELVQSWKPFAATATLDVEARTKSILTPIHLALEMAHAEESASKVLEPLSESGPERWTWRRGEKLKKQQWMVTCGLPFASIVYAYSGIALNHADQPAKEISAMTGIPSSDGAAIPDSSSSDAVLDRLDRTWENVVSPLLSSYFKVKGVDRLKTHAWSVLFALTSSKTPEEWSLDRLLCSRYLSGEAFVVTAKEVPKEGSKEKTLTDFVVDIEASAIRPSEVPTWGPAWISHRIETLLDSWQAALEGVPGLADPFAGKMYPQDGKDATIPVILSKIWLNLLRALSTARSTEAIGADVFNRGVHAVTAKIVEVFNMDPRKHLPIQLFGADDECVQDLDATRIALATFLVESSIEILGRETFASLRLDRPSDIIEGTSTDLHTMAFANDNEERPTMSGAVLGHLLRTTALSLPLLPSTRFAFKDLVQKTMKAGLANGNPTKLLGDITNCLPFLFTTCEEMQLDVWRLLATQWTETIDVQPSSASSNGTNHTGVLLLSLLSGPFHGRDITSVWHQQATQDDLRIWQDLLRVTVLRFRAKRVGSNLGVLETLAGHLGDFLEPEAKTNSTTITLSCLASAISWITFVPAEHYHASHFINENTVPVDFLALVGQSLDDSYPAQDSESFQESEAVLSPAITDVLQAINGVFESLPAEYVHDCLAPIQASVALWMDDGARVADASLGRVLDDLYMTLLAAISRAIASKHLPASADTLDTYFDIFAPRLSRALSPAVPRAFQTFWKTSFEHLRNLEFSLEVKEFLRDVISAVPGIIEVHGLEVGASMSEEESIARFPNAQILTSQAVALPVAREEADEPMEGVPTASEDVPMPLATHEVSTEYDADVSSSIVNTQVPEVLVPSTAEEEPQLPLEPMALLVPIKEESPAPVSAGADVFGPAGVVLAKGKGNGRVPKRTPSAPAVQSVPVVPTRALSRSQSAPEPIDVDESDAEDEITYIPTPNDRTNRPIGSSQESAVAAPPNRSILSSAGRWLSNRATSFFSPVTHTTPLAEGVPPSGLSASEDDHSVEAFIGSSRSPRKVSYGEKRAAEPESDEEGTPKKKQKSKTSRPSSRASSRSSTGSSRKAAQKAKRSMVRHSSSDSSTFSNEIKAPAEDDEEEEEDELLLSPETARKQRKAEEAEISEQMLAAERSLENSPAAKRAMRMVQKQASQLSSSGRFYDAPEDRDRRRSASAHATASPTPTPVPGPSGETPDGRQQLRVLSMVESAARHKSAIERMDLHEVMRLMRYMNELRDAATANLEERAKNGGR